MSGLAGHKGDVLLVANPISGSGVVARWLDAVADGLRALGLTVQVVKTRGPGDARGAARDFAGGVILSFGGDGTFNEVLNGADLDRCVLGIMPAGTGNVLAKELGLRGKPLANLRAMAEGKVVNLDLGVCNGRRFISVFGAGLDAHIVRLVHEARSGHLTQFHYVPVALQYAVRPQRWEMDVWVDGKPFISGVDVVCVGNSHSYGGPIEMTPAASPADGLLDVMATRAAHVGEAWQPLLATFLRSLHASGSAAYSRGRCVRVTSSRCDVPWEVDGDVGGELPADVHCEPQRVRLLAPAAFRPAAKGYRSLRRA